MRLRKFFVCLAVMALLIPARPILAAADTAKDAKVEKPTAEKETLKDAVPELAKGTPEWLAKGSVYSPEGCEFEVAFPEQPYQTKRCDPVDKDQNCSQMTTFTKVYGIDSSITYNVSCTPTTGDMYDKYDDNVMRTTLSGMTRSLNLEQSQTGFMLLKEAKMSVLLGSGKTENKQDDLIYTAQLWIGHKSVFTLEGELRGKYQPDSDLLFAEILKTAKLKGTATPIDLNGNEIAPKGKSAGKADDKSSPAAGAMALEAAKLEKSKNEPDKK